MQSHAPAAPRRAPVPARPARPAAARSAARRPHARAAACLRRADRARGVALLGGASRTDEAFAWTIQPPLAAAFLGAGYASGCVLVLLTLRAGTWSQARWPLLTILVFTVLTLAGDAAPPRPLPPARRHRARHGRRRGSGSRCTSWCRSAWPS